MIKKIIFLLGLFIFPQFISAQISVEKVSTASNYSNSDGFFYSLPRMGIRLNIEYEKIIKIKGPYSDYANEFLGLEDIIASNTTEYRVKEVSLETFYLPDPEEIYFVSYNLKDSKDYTELKLNFSAKGYFVGSSAFLDLKGIQADVMEQETEMDAEEIERYFNYYPENNLYEKIDTIVKKISIDTTTIDTYSFKKRTLEKYPVLKAKEAAANIEKVRESQYNLITGYQEVAYSEGAIKFMYDKLESMEDDYLDLFRGKIFKEEYNYSSIFVPKAGDNDKWIPILKFSSENGTDQQSEGDNIFLRFTLTENTSLIKQSYDANTGDSKGFYYRVPEYSSISVRYKQQSADLLQTIIPQFGVIVNAPFTATDVSVYPETGNIRSATIKY
ncbi:DUF4831 family protein [Bacteroidota bacterium]